jgi:hypothetical protein
MLNEISILANTSADEMHQNENLSNFNKQELSHFFKMMKDKKTDTEIMIGDGAGSAVFAALSGDATMSNAGVVTVTGATGNFQAGGYISNAGGTLVWPVIPTTAGTQALSGPGAVNITSYQTQFTSTGTGDALTLADAAIAGHLKKITYVAEGGGADTGVLTPTNLAGGTTLTFNAVGDYAVLMWNGADWLVIDTVGTTLA